jgi:hypothetical protein
VNHEQTTHRCSRKEAASLVGSEIDSCCRKQQVVQSSSGPHGELGASRNSPGAASRGESKRERGGAGDVGRRAVTAAAAAVWRTAEHRPAASLTLLRPLGRDATGAAREWPEGERRTPAGYAQERPAGTQSKIGGWRCRASCCLAAALPSTRKLASPAPVGFTRASLRPPPPNIYT